MLCKFQNPVFFILTRNVIFAKRSEGKGKPLREENRREGRVVFERRILAKNGIQPSSEVKSGQARLALGCVTTFKHKPLC